MRIRFLVLVLALVSIGILGHPAPAGAAVLITIDKSVQRMLVAVDGRPRHSWAVSTGRAQYETPSGRFRPFRLSREHFSREWDDAPMPHSIFFTSRGHAIHGSRETRRLGRRASHGCVRLAPSHAAALFALVEGEGLGATRIVITEASGSASRPVVERKRPRRSSVWRYLPPEGFDDIMEEVY